MTALQLRATQMVHEKILGLLLSIRLDAWSSVISLMERANINLRRSSR